MKKIYLSAPQWQDSGLSSELYDGAINLRNYCISKFGISTENIDINTSKKPELENNILGYQLLKSKLADIQKTLNKNQPNKVITLGGGCGIELPIVSYLSKKYPELFLYWFDAHGDLNSPETSVSKHFHGMPLRFITEKQDNDIFESFCQVPFHRISLIGARELDKPEADYIQAKEIRTIGINQKYQSELNDCIQPGKYAYIHIDLDVLDPAEYKNVKCPVKNGLSIEVLEESAKLMIEKMNVVGISILENTETKESEIDKLHRILEQIILL